MERTLSAEAAQALQREREQLEESLRHVIAQREQLRGTYEALIAERDAEAAMLNKTLDGKEKDLDALRENAKDIADAMRKKIETLRQTNNHETLKHGPTSAAGWSAFETGVRFLSSPTMA